MFFLKLLFVAFPLLLALSASAEVLVVKAGDFANARAVIEYVSANPSIDEIDISNSSFSIGDQALIAESISCRCNRKLYLFGSYLTSADREISFTETYFKDEYALLECFRPFYQLEKLDVGKCNLSNETLAAIRAKTDYELVWLLRFDIWRVKTDATAFSTLNNGDYRKPSKTFECLKYCSNLYALDLGHNSISDLYFLEGLTSLRYLILADNCIEDISILSTMPDLEYIELFFNNITNLNALSNMEKLVDLNVCFCPISDYSALQTLPQLERLWFSSKGLTETDKTLISSYFSNCSINFTTKNAVEEGWRTHPHYNTIRTTFRGGSFMAFDVP